MDVLQEDSKTDAETLNQSSLPKIEIWCILDSLHSELGSDDITEQKDGKTST